MCCPNCTQSGRRQRTSTGHQLYRADNEDVIRRRMMPSRRNWYFETVCAILISVVYEMNRREKERMMREATRLIERLHAEGLSRLVTPEPTLAW